MSAQPTVWSEWSGRLTAGLAWVTALATPALLGWAFWVATGGGH